MRGRGALLLEVLLSLAIFVGAALAVGGALRRATQGLDAVRERAEASDLAWSAIAQLEAGLAAPGSLSGAVGEPGTRPTGVPGWSRRIETEPTERSGLTLVTVEVHRTTPEGTELERPVAVARQIVRLSRVTDVEPAGESSVEPDGSGLFGPGGDL